ncbi:MAG: DegT/DnrJ/EryC1/StrS family aminotransferase [Planctomycetota bacterium]
MIPHSRPMVGREEERAVVRVLRSGQLGGGAEVERFEAELARRVGAASATATHTGTAALHLTLLAMGLGRGSRVLLPSYVCMAVLNAVRYVGARPVLVDVDPETCNIDPADAKRRARGASAVIVPHMFGLPAPLDAIARLRIPIIEDCAMSIGARRKGRPVGSFGQASVFSFYATKMLASGHGGAVATSRARLARRIRDLVNYDNRNDDRVRHNYRMSAVAAALARVQLRRAGEFVKARRRIAEFYYARLGALSIALPPGENHVFYRFVLRAGRRLERRLGRRGIEAKRPVYRPLHLYRSERSGNYPGAEELHRTAVSIPIYPALTRDARRRVAEAVREAADALA